MVSGVGLLTDYYAARDNEDARRALHRGPRQNGFAAVEAKSLEPLVTMATLEEILTGTDAMGIIETNTDAVVGRATERGPWVFRVRDSLVSAFGEPDAERLFSTAQAWAATEELAGADPRQLYEFLWGLAHLSKWATANHQTVYCWTSL
jgi:hypothetical protein